MSILIPNIEYISHVVKKSRALLLQNERNNVDLSSADKVFEYILNSSDLLKDLYLLSHSMKTKEIAGYFLFILKKLEEGEINFDNFQQNSEADSAFIRKEIIKNFPPDKEALRLERKEKKERELARKEQEKKEALRKQELEKQQEHIEGEAIEISEEKLLEVRSQDNEYDSKIDVSEELEETNQEKEEIYESLDDLENPEEDEVEDTSTEDENEEESQSDQEEESKELAKKLSTLKVSEVLKENRFKVEEIDNELVTEEFSESELTISRTFSRPPVIDENKIENTEETGNIDNTKEESRFAESEYEGFTIKKKIINEDYSESVEEDSKAEPEEDANHTAGEDVKEDVKEDEKEDEKEEKSRPEEIFEEESELVETFITEDFQGPLQEHYEEEVDDKSSGKEENIEEVLQEEESGEMNSPLKKNKSYQEYEKRLAEVSSILNLKFDIILKIEEDSIDMPAVYNEVIELSSGMEEYSRKMSFHIITGIYGTIRSYFEFMLEYSSETGRSAEAGAIELFRKGLHLIENLIRGEDYLGYDEVVKSMDALKEDIIYQREHPVENEEEIRQGTREIELPDIVKGQDNALEEKTKDDKEAYEDEKAESNEVQETEKEESGVSQSGTVDKAHFKTLKQLILDLEETFSSLDEIQGYYQNYEGLRRLSNTFAILKEIIILSKAINSSNLARLAEASYIFIKFLQNYRLDPFDKEVKEIFTYIIFNFKLIALDKPTRDLEVFISYLNDPVKIFTQNKNKKSKANSKGDINE